MMLFDSGSGDNIVIVPPKPDAFLSYGTSFASLYNGTGAGGGCGASTATATTTAGTLSRGESMESGSSTASSLASINERTTASFDAGAFDSVPRGSNSTDADAGPKLPANSTAITRDPRNGAFTFQVNAEYDLLLHIQKGLDKNGRRNLSDVELSKIIMRSVDEYCLRKQWMYHIGSEKAVAIGRFLREGVEMFLKNRAEAGATNGEVKVST